MTIEEIIDKFKLYLIESGVNAGKIAGCINKPNESELNFIREHKAEIVAELTRREEAERQRIELETTEVSLRQINIFGKKFEFNMIYKVDNVIKKLTELKKTIAEKTVIERCYCSVLPGNYMKNICDTGKCGEILDTEIERAVKENGLESVFDIDPAATAERNEGLTGDYYRVGYYKSEVIIAIQTKCDEYITEMKSWINDMTAEAEASISAEIAYRASWEEIKVHKHVAPKGGELGVDGFHDATYRRISDGAEVRIVSRDVFDVGKYNAPERHKDLREKCEYTEAEEECLNWLRKYPVFGRGVRM